jgi:protein-L-isoaspartate(D-aspartate) O-methyltransferase
MGPVAKAFQKIKRINFVPEGSADQADIDAPLPIGFGQTISQPTTVRMMLEWLDVKQGNKVLDVGSGSGWTSALLSYLVGAKGKVYAVEKIPELLDLGRKNNQKAGTRNVKFYLAGWHYGLLKFAPYDRILVSAAANEVPKELLDQLKTGGKIVLPVNNDVLEIIKPSIEEYEVSVHTGFAFVPLV